MTLTVTSLTTCFTLQAVFLLSLFLLSLSLCFSPVYWLAAQTKTPNDKTPMQQKPLQSKLLKNINAQRLKLGLVEGFSHARFCWRGLCPVGALLSKNVQWRAMGKIYFPQCIRARGLSSRVNTVSSARLTTILLRI